MKPQPHYLFGTHACLAALDNPMRKIRRVLVTKQAQAQLGGKALAGAKNIQDIDARKLEALLPPGAVHQGIAVECEKLAQPSLEEWLGERAACSVSGVREEKTPNTEHAAPNTLLLLDQVTDHHNVGAILRSAAAFGAGAVIVTDRHAPAESGVMAKAASGALETVPLITVTNLAQSIDTLKKHGYWVAGLDGEAKQALHEAKLDAKTALVLGAEGAGLRRLTAERCDFLLRLPMSARMESLNVSNAAAVALYELYRRHEA